MVFFFAEDDAYVPVEESVTHFRQVARASDVTTSPDTGNEPLHEHLQTRLHWSDINRRHPRPVGLVG